MAAPLVPYLPLPPVCLAPRPTVDAAGAYVDLTLVPDSPVYIDLTRTRPRTRTFVDLTGGAESSIDDSESSCSYSTSSSSSSSSWSLYSLTE